MVIPYTDPTLVYILQSGFTQYSENLVSEDLPECRVLNEMCQINRQAEGKDIFEQSIKPGDVVVIKPNLVRDWHPDDLNLYAVITHPAIIRAVIDQVFRCLQGEGQIIIADAPMGDTDFSHLLSVTGLEQICRYYWEIHHFPIEIRDLRSYRYHHQKQTGGYMYEVRSNLPGDPDGYEEIDLGTQSAFDGMNGVHLLEGTDIARRRETIAGHSRGSNRYLIARTVLNADVIVSIPKLKTHSKVGLTINCKGMVGVNGDKNLLPHFRWGSASEGGDQFPDGSQTTLNQNRMRLGRFVGDTLISQDSALAKSVLTAIQSTSSKISALFKFASFDPINGDWSGNDTCWRLAVDLIRVVMYADRNGKIQSKPQRRFISIVDGIIAGEGNGPLRPIPKHCGVLIAGTHPVAVDVVCARLMGFDPLRIRYLAELIQGDASNLIPKFPAITPEKIELITNQASWQNLFEDPQDRCLNFTPPRNWADHLGIS